MEPASGPPIIEVVLSISFDEQETLAGPRLVVALQDLLKLYPEIEEQLPYEMQDELPTAKQLANAGPSGFQLIGPTGPTNRRYWLTSKSDKSILIQAQSGYFALNWRTGRATEGYPGFKRLKELFFDALGRFQNTISLGGGEAPTVRQVETSYINRIHPPSGQRDHQYLNQVLDIQAPFLSEVEQFNVAFTRPLSRSDGLFFGRAYTTIQTGYRVADSAMNSPVDLSIDPDLEPIINLSTSVRSARHKSLTAAEVSDFLDLEHREATTSFKSVTTRSARENWGLK